jgi:hypothetical protein
MYKTIIGLVLLACTPVVAVAQDSDGDNAYRSEFVELHGKVTGLIRRSLAASTDEQKQALGEESLLVTRRIHSLEESTEGADLAALKQGGRPHKILLLISQGCYMMDAALNSAGSYMQTGDSLFMVVAKESDALADKLSSAIR